jgi:3-dehydroquinate synthase
VERILIGSEQAPVSEVLVASGSIAQPDPTTIVPSREGRATVAVLTQPGAAATLARRVRRSLLAAGLRAEVRVVPDRDAAKTLAIAEECYLWLNELALTRRDVLVGIGGGALTDLAGFVAATYLRGVDAVYLPTTLLGAVDAAVGGKTGVNIGGKNLVGVFHHPVRVLIDPDVLAGLPPELIVEGTAEAVKCGFIADPALVRLYEDDGIDAPLEEVVTRAVTVKASVVSEDFREQGRREILNYGHTVGHAVEVAGAMSHGHAVAVGMVAAGTAAAEVTGFAEASRQRDLLARLGLPVETSGLSPSRVRSLMALDKKRRGAGLRMVLLERMGRAVVRAVDPATVDRALDSVGVRATGTDKEHGRR